MEELIPAWVIKRYKKLWGKFATNKFTFEQAGDVLEEKDEKFISVVLSELDKLKWMDVELDANDRRRRVYRLKSMDNVIKKQVASAFGINEEDLSVRYDKIKR